MELLEMIRTPGVLPADPGENRVLVVDDDLGQRALLARLMRRAGYDCAAAMSTEEARNLLRSETFGIVVTDLRMWGEHGLELIRHIADRYPGTYSIAVTGFFEEDLERQCRQSGAFQLVHKPFDASRLVGVVTSAFEDRSEKVALRRHQGLE